MELRKGATVVSVDGEEIGSIERVVMDPATREVSHLVVQKGFLISRDRLVPVDTVQQSTEEQVILKKTHEEVEDMPEFEETHYVPLKIESREGKEKKIVTPLYWYPPIGTPIDYYGYPIRPFYKETERHIPEGSIPLKEGARVESADGTRVGNVESVFTDPSTGKATHFLIAKGIFLKDQKLVPTQWILKVEEDTVKLAVDAPFIETLSEYSG